MGYSVKKTKAKGVRRPVRSLPHELVGSTHRKGPVEVVVDTWRRCGGLEAKSQFP